MKCSRKDSESIHRRETQNWLLISFGFTSSHSTQMDWIRNNNFLHDRSNCVPILNIIYFGCIYNEDWVLRIFTYCGLACVIKFTASRSVVCLSASWRTRANRVEAKKRNWYNLITRGDRRRRLLCVSSESTRWQASTPPSPRG